MQKKKKCKPTGKALGVIESCGGYYSPVVDLRLPNYGLCPECKNKFYFETDIGKQIIQKKSMSALKKVQKQKKSERNKDAKSKVSIQALILEVRKPFQWLIRVRDVNKPCICCGKFLGPDIGAYDAGHFLKAERNSALIFHPDNVHGQRVHCNQHLHGNHDEYAQGLNRRIGQERLEALYEIKKKAQSFKFDRHYLSELKKHYIGEVNAVKKGLKSIDDVDFSKGIINL